MASPRKKTQDIAPPTEVEVAGKTYSVAYGKMTGTDMGECDSYTQSIRINTEMHQEQQQDALFHELYHAVDHEAYAKLTEGQVRRHSTMMLATLKKNPALVEYILKTIDNGKDSE